MSYSIELMCDTTKKNRPNVVVRGDGAYRPATTMAIIADVDLVILPFIEGIGKSQCTQLFELDLNPTEPKLFRFVVQTVDGHPLGPQVEALIEPRSEVLTWGTNGGAIA
ncbi:MAG: hypothetical protein WAU70_09255 [Flavobacteriales bacterium]